MIIAVDTGGTKTLVGRFSDGGKLEKKQRFETPKNIPTYLATLRKTITEIANGQPVTLLSIGVPGSVRADGEIIYTPHLGWRNVNLPELLSQWYDCSIVIENDANLAGLAETRALRHIPSISLYVTVSTGIGTGVIINGAIDKALSLSEGGQAVMEYDGAMRVWESFAAGSAIYKTYGKPASEITSKRTWHQITDRISRGLLTYIPLLQPQVIIIGGGVGTHFDRFGEELKDLLDERLPRHIVLRPQIVQAKHPEEAVLYGCYYHAVDQPAA